MICKACSSRTRLTLLSPTKHKHADNGYKYIVNTKRQSTTYYQCSTNLSTGCKGKLNVKIEEGGASDVRETGEHTCKKEPRSTLRDCAEEMKQILEVEAIASPAIIPGRLWDRVSSQIVAKYPGQAVKPMVRGEAINFINYVRKAATGGDVFRQIETSPSVMVSDSDDRSFVQFNVFYDNVGKRQRIVGMGHPDLLRLLRYPRASLFIDGTFSITPKPFQQTLIIMAHDPSYDVYLPVLMILLEAKDEWTFWHALHWVRVLGKMQMTPGSDTCDFEAALIRRCPRPVRRNASDWLFISLEASDSPKVG
jgi:hypothetical protein